MGFWWDFDRFFFLAAVFRFRHIVGEGRSWDKPLEPDLIRSLNGPCYCVLLCLWGDALISTASRKSVSL